MRWSRYFLGEHLDLYRCPHCNVDTPSMRRVWGTETQDSEGFNKRRWDIYCCARCGGLVTASGGAKDRAIQSIFPKPQSVDETIPKRPRQFLLEAIETTHAPSGSIMLCASAVDAMLKEKGYSEGNLHKRIQHAATDHLITAEMAAWAHEVRLDANEQRHADANAALPTRDDATKAVEFALALAQYLFVLPARVQRGRAQNPSHS